MRPSYGCAALACAFALAAGPLLAQADTTHLTLTLDSAVSRALAVAPPVSRAQLSSRLAGAELLRSYAGLLPAAGASTGLGVTTGTMLLGQTATVASDTRFQTAGYQIGTSLNVLSPIGGYPAVRASRDVSAAAGFSLERVRQTVTLDVTQAYLQAVLDSQLTGIARDNASVSEQRVQQVSELVRIGKRPPADQFQAQAQASAYEAQLIDAENRQRIDQTLLLERIRLQPRESLTLATPPVDTVLLRPLYDSLPAIANDALRRRIDLEAARTQVNAARWNIRRTDAEDLPSLNVGALLFSNDRYYDKRIQGGVNELPLPQRPLADQYFSQTSTLFTVGVGYDLGSLFRARVDQQEARVQFDAAQLTEDTVRLQVVGDVTRAQGEYRNAVQSLAVSATGLVAAQGAYDLVSGRYDVGFATIVDLLTAQAALAQARVTRVQAIVQLELSKRALSYALGFDPRGPPP